MKWASRRSHLETFIFKSIHLKSDTLLLVFNLNIICQSFDEPVIFIDVSTVVREGSMSGCDIDIIDFRLLLSENIKKTIKGIHIFDTFYLIVILIQIIGLFTGTAKLFIIMY